MDFFTLALAKSLNTSQSSFIEQTLIKSLSADSPMYNILISIDFFQ